MFPLALFSSRSCPATLAMASLELARALGESGVGTIGGFHAPVEQAMLRELLRGRGSVEVCPARAVQGMRVPAAWRPFIAEGRLVISSPCSVRRITAASAAERNRHVAERAGAIFIAHATGGGALERLALELLAAGRRLYTWESPFCERLRAAGAARVSPDTAAIAAFVAGLAGRR